MEARIGFEYALGTSPYSLDQLALRRQPLADLINFGVGATVGYGMQAVLMLEAQPMRIAEGLYEGSALLISKVSGMWRTTEPEAMQTFRSKTVEEMAHEISDAIGKNSVKFRTSDRLGHIDLRGEGHMDKLTKVKIPTPHVQSRKVNIGPNGQINTSSKTEILRPATKTDIRIARRLAEQQGLLNNRMVFNEQETLVQNLNRSLTP